MIDKNLFNLHQTFECPNCSKLMEVNFWKFEIIFDGTIVGVCKGCKRKIIIRLFTEAVEDNEERKRIERVLGLEYDN